MGPQDPHDPVTLSHSTDAAWGQSMALESWWEQKGSLSAPRTQGWGCLPRSPAERWPGTGWAWQLCPGQPCPGSGPLPALGRLSQPRCRCCSREESRPPPAISGLWFMGSPVPG